MAVFNIRDMPPDLHARVKHAATDQKTSMEKLILAAIEKSFPAPRMVQPLQKGGK